ncbi:MAG: hypothetical protein CVU56_01115 [Deltaproteobacteria bacterium HGW-Deltaproteobacteria-14]|nr:MAG: hypothetical protein CVU56_01115 [Deltaproteobacteria bacterium HGW-Deltaproteobacteria-14]
MDTAPDLLETRSALGWRPFGDAIPLPARRRTPAPTAPPPRAAVSPAAAPRGLPLWLPFAVALVIGALVALIALVTAPDAAPDAVGATPVRVLDEGTLARPGAATVVPLGSSPLLGDWAGYAWSDRPGATPRRPGRRARAVEGRPFAPERVSDLKANPFTLAQRVPRSAARPWHPRKVGDLKVNPFTN